MNVPTPEELNARIVAPFTYWFIRINQNDPNVAGPFDYRQARSQARFLSRANPGPGIAQIITVVGDRKIDVPQPLYISVDSIYTRGLRIAQGAYAQFLSDRNLPIPTNG